MAKLSDGNSIFSDFSMTKNRNIRSQYRGRRRKTTNKKKRAKVCIELHDELKITWTESLELLKFFDSDQRKIETITNLFHFTYRIGIVLSECVDSKKASCKAMKRIPHNKHPV